MEIPIRILYAQWLEHKGNIRLYVATWRNPSSGWKLDFSLDLWECGLLQNRQYHLRPCLHISGPIRSIESFAFFRWPGIGRKRSNQRNSRNVFGTVSS